MIQSPISNLQSTISSLRREATPKAAVQPGILWFSWEQRRKDEGEMMQDKKNPKKLMTPKGEKPNGSQRMLT